MINIFKMNYITKEDIIIFSSYFNKKINEELLSNYKKVIFSNYELTNNSYNNYVNNYFKYCKYICPKFNQKAYLLPILTN